MTEPPRTTTSCVYLWILRSFWDYLFHIAPLRNYLFHVQVAGFQPSNTVKKYFISAFQTFYTRTGSRHSKAFFETSSFMITSRLVLPKKLWKCTRTISFRQYKRKVVFLVIYLFNYDSSKSAFFMLNMTFDVLLSIVFVK